MGIFSFFRPAPSSAPSEQTAGTSAEATEKLRKSVATMNHEQLNRLLQRIERGRRQLTEEELSTIEEHMEHLAGTIRDDSNAHAIKNSRSLLASLRSRTNDGSGAASAQEASQEGGGSLTGSLGFKFGAGILSFFGLRSLIRHGPMGPVRGLFTGARGVAGGSGRLGLGAVNFARRNPLMAALTAGLGIGVGVRVHEYLNQNSDALTTEIEAVARETGQPAQEVARRTGERIADFIRSAGSSTVDTFVKGVVFVFQGTIDPETGAITLPHSSLRPAFWVAYQAGQRAQFGSSRTWRYLQGFRLNPFKAKEERMLGIVETAGKQSGDRARQIKFLANEADTLYRTVNNPAVSAAERANAERRLKPILETLNGHERISSGTNTSTRPLDKGDIDTGRRLQAIAAEADQLHARNTTDFPALRSSINAELVTVEQNVRNGTGMSVGESVEDYKKRMLFGDHGIHTRVSHSMKELEARKMSLGQQYANALTAHTRGRLDTAGGGYIDATRKTMENTGYKFARIPAGKWVVRAAVGYSLLPMGMETLSYFTNLAEGNPKLRRLQEMKASGSVMSETEVRELSRLENLGTSVRNDWIQFGGGFVPVVGEALDFKAAFTGRDLNGRELSTASRVTSGVMGVLGTASLVLAPFTFGGSAVAWRAVRGGASAGRALRRANNVEDSVRAVRQSSQFIEQARGVGQLSGVQRAAVGARGYVQMARSGMQIYTYGHLGYHLGAGAVDFAATSAQKIAGVKERAADFVEGLDERVLHDGPQRLLPGQAPEESGHSEAA